MLELAFVVNIFRSIFIPKYQWSFCWRSDHDSLRFPTKRITSTVADILNVNWAAHTTRQNSWNI